ncbi:MULTISPECIES: MobQ family relaxase [Sphingomonas]|uniref:MobQ family relaxase n=3 Tax=Pseudomonadota TaxID=1224 RepID=UPI001AE199A7
MALFSMRVQQIKRSAGQSPVAAAAYRAGERLHDERQGITHDYTRKTGIVHKEIMVPDNAPAWARKLDRESLWNMVDKRERRKDAQTAREIRIMLPREIAPDARVALVRDFVRRNFVDLGMIADVAIHCPKAADGQDQPHAHVLLTMREILDSGFGDKSRHDWVPDPMGRTHSDGRPVMVESNAQSWNSAAYYERCREDWENTANAALERAGSAERIDRRSYLERGLSKLPEPFLGVAMHLKTLHGVMQERFGQFQVARHYRVVEARAKAAFDRLAASPTRVGEAASMAKRFHAWFERMADRLSDPPDLSRTPPRRPPDLSPTMDR